MVIFLGRACQAQGTFKCKGLEAAVCMMCAINSREVNVAGVGLGRESVIDEARE